MLKVPVFCCHGTLTCAPYLLAKVFSRKEQRAALRQLGMILQLHFLGYCLYGKADDLHRWRIAMKKLRAFRALYNLDTGGKKAGKAARQLKLLYRQTGRVRQEQLNQAAVQRMTTDYGKPPEEVPDAALTRQIERANRWVRAYIRLLRNAARSLSNKELRQHFRRNIHALHKKFRRMHSVQELHDCRMVIKDLIYQYQALPGRVKRKLAINLSYLQQVEEAIGEWHDAALALEWGVAQELIDPSVLTRLERESAALLENALKKTRNFKNRAS